MVFAENETTVAALHHLTDQDLNGPGLPFPQRVSLRRLGRASLLRYCYSADNRCCISSFPEIQREYKALAVGRPLSLAAIEH
jgi:hypothetical protein